MQVTSESAAARRVRIAISAAVVAVLFVPVLTDRDSFPLSVYPMYASARSDESNIVLAVGVDAQGERRELSLALIGDSDDPLVVAGELRTAIAVGRADDRCVEIAARLETSGADDVVAIEVATERHNTVQRTMGEASLIGRTVHATCPVGDRA